jgi:hypothetical protein
MSTDLICAAPVLAVELVTCAGPLTLELVLLFGGHCVG